MDRPKDEKCLIRIFQCIRLIEKIGEFSINDLKVLKASGFLEGSHKLSISMIK